MSAPPEKNRQAMASSDTASAKTVKKSGQIVLDGLAKELVRIDKVTQALVESDDQWKNRLAQLRTVPDVGPVTAVTLLAELPEPRIAARYPPPTAWGGKALGRGE